MSEPQPGGSHAPTVLRVILGKRLRQLRESRQLRPEDAAKVLRVNPLTIRRMENAQVGLKIPYVEKLLRSYAVGPREIDEFVTLAERGNEPDWWHPYRDAVPNWFSAYVSLETDAQLIRVYEPHYVTGLLQTRDYARAVMRAGFPDEPDASLEQRVDLRMGRQGLLDQEDAPNLWVVTEEAALRRNVGGCAVTQAQLDHLINAVERPHVTLRILPIGVGSHPGAGGHFTYFRFAAHELQDIVYTEIGLTGAAYLDQRPDVLTHLDAHTRISQLADERVPDTRTFLNHLRKEFET